MKKFCDALKTIYDLKSSRTTQTLNIDGNLFLTDKNTVLEGWDERFDSLLLSTDYPTKGGV